MTSAFEVMTATKNSNTNVSHNFYAQGEYKWEKMFQGQKIERKAGVCNGLCLRWIKSAHQTSLLNILSSYSDNLEKKRQAIMTSVIVRQEQSVALNKKPLLPSRKARDGFGSLAVSKCSENSFFTPDERYPNQEGIMCKDQPKLRRTVAKFMAEGRSDCKYASLIHMTPESPSEVGHTVAVVAWLRKVRFFDPNGGVLEFRSRDSFRSWFETDFGKISFYGAYGTLFDVANYRYVDEQS
jgi:hypothetical protein